MVKKKDDAEPVKNYFVATFKNAAGEVLHRLTIPKDAARYFSVEEVHGMLQRDFWTVDVLHKPEAVIIALDYYYSKNKKKKVQIGEFDTRAKKSPPEIDKSTGLIRTQLQVPGHYLRPKSTLH